MHFIDVIVCNINKGDISMLKSYYEALELFGIQSGFVEEQIEEIYSSLKNIYKPEDFEFFSPEYMEMSDKRHQLNMAYFRLRSSLSHYIVDQNSTSMNEEQMIAEISKLIYDYTKKGINLDKKFIAKLVEILVSFKSLHQYVRDVEFNIYEKDTIATYQRAGRLTIYEHNLQKISNNLEGTVKIYYPFYRTVSVVRHEIEHADWRKQVDRRKTGIRTFLCQACETYQKNYDENFERIVQLPSLIFEILHVLLKLEFFIQDRKYDKNWLYSPKERVAEISGNSLVLSLIDQAPNKEILQEIQNSFIDSITQILFSGYDKPLGPTDFYLSRFYQFEDCLQILEMSKTLSLEERLLFGLKVTPEELKQAISNKEKVLSGIRKIC